MFASSFAKWFIDLCFVDEEMETSERSHSRSVLEPDSPGALRSDPAPPLPRCCPLLISSTQLLVSLPDTVYYKKPSLPSSPCYFYSFPFAVTENEGSGRTTTRSMWVHGGPPSLGSLTPSRAVPGPAGRASLGQSPQALDTAGNLTSRACWWHMMLVLLLVCSKANQSPPCQEMQGDAETRRGCYAFQELYTTGKLNVFLTQLLLPARTQDKPASAFTC